MDYIPIYASMATNQLKVPFIYASIYSRKFGEGLDLVSWSFATKPPN